MTVFTARNGAILLLGLGIACLLAFRFIGSSVDAEGMLHEPFALIPLGYLFLLLGGVMGLWAMFRS